MTKLYILLGLFIYSSSPSWAIINGDKITADDPLNTTVVQITNSKKNSSLCTGSLVASRWILTAAHCLEIAGPNEIIVENSVQKFKVKDLYPHPEYSSYDLFNDIALIEIDPTDISPLPLATNDSDVTLDRILMPVGRGRVNDPTEGSPVFDGLKKSTLSILEPTPEDEFYKYPTILLDQSHKTGICDGDSGGPLLSNGQNGNVILGVASQIPFEIVNGQVLDTCLTKSVFMSVIYYRQWIDQVINSQKLPH